MKTLFLTVCTLLMLRVHAQDIFISKGGIQFNKEKLSGMSTAADVIRVFGAPEFKEEGVENRWLYPSKGITFFFSTSSGHLKAMTVAFIRNDDEHANAKAFEGKLRICDTIVNKTTTMKAISTLSCATMEEQTPVMIPFNVGDLVLYIERSVSDDLNKMLYIYF